MIEAKGEENAQPEMQIDPVQAGGGAKFIQNGSTFSLRISSLLGAGETEPIGVVAIDKCPALYV